MVFVTKLIFSLVKFSPQLRSSTVVFEWNSSTVVGELIPATSGAVNYELGLWLPVSSTPLYSDPSLSLLRHAAPTPNARIFEAFSCSTWELTISLKATLETEDKNVTYSFEMVSGMTYHEYNLTVSVSAGRHQR
jgi:hypothetical protein